MSSRVRRKSAVMIVVVGALGSGHVAQAAPYTWDTVTGDGTAVTAGSGTWNLTNTNWNDGTTNVAWPTGNTAIFAGADGAAGSYVVSIAANVSNVAGININSNGYHFQGAQSITFADHITVAAGKSASIGSGLTLTRGSNFSVLGGGTLTIGSDGTVQATSGSLSVAGGATVIVSGGIFGTATTIPLIVGGEGTTGTLTLTTGTVTAGLNDAATRGLRVGTSANAGSAGTVNLDGGILSAGKVFTQGGSSTLNFNGGTLRALGGTSTPNFITGLTSANVKEGGAKFDSNGFNITIAQPLLHAGAAAYDGGLSKSGAGKLTLTGVNTYTGNTTISGGSFELADNARLAFLIGGDGINNAITGGPLELNGDFSFDLNGTGTAAGDSWLIVDSASKTYGSSFSILGFTEAADVWTREANGVTYAFTEATGVLTVVPEPASLATLAAAAGLLLGRRRISAQKRPKVETHQRQNWSCT